MSASSCNTSSAVDAAPFGVFLITGNSIFTNRISCSCFGELRLNGCSAMSCALASSSNIRAPSSTLCASSFDLSINTPWRSTVDKILTSGNSTSLNNATNVGSASIFFHNTLCKRNVTSASSAAYGDACSNSIWLKVNCFLPLPAISSKLMVLCPKYLSAKLSISWRVAILL